MNSTDKFVLPEIASYDQWLIERKKLLKAERELTRKRDELNAMRRGLPMTGINKEYSFNGEEGAVDLQGLFAGRRQLIVYHFMLDPGWEEGCPGCSLLADIIGDLSHLHARDTSLVMVSRAPLNKIMAYKKRMGWSVPWYSSFGSDFNFDFHVSIDQSVAPVEYNYQSKDELEQSNPRWVDWSGELPGISVFITDRQKIFHTYSSYARGLEMLLGSLMYLDLTPLGRQEFWEKPGGRGNSNPGAWWRRHDQYNK